MNKAASPLLLVNEPGKLQQLFKDRYSIYVNAKGKPTRKLIRLLCNGDDYMQNKIRAAVQVCQMKEVRNYVRG